MPISNTVGGIHVELKANLIETTGEFLDALGDGLTRKDGVDVNLADILKAHILKAAPDQNAVAKAKDAILKLADERASDLKSEVTNG
jgi:hypothetical protein